MGGYDKTTGFFFGGGLRKSLAGYKFGTFEIPDPPSPGRGSFHTNQPKLRQTTPGKQTKRCIAVDLQSHQTRRITSKSTVTHFSLQPTHGTPGAIQKKAAPGLKCKASL